MAERKTGDRTAGRKTQESIKDSGGRTETENTPAGCTETDRAILPGYSAFREVRIFRKGKLQDKPLPFSAAVADDEADRPHQPVDGHGHPDAEDTHMEDCSQKDAEAEAENPHG